MTPHYPELQDRILCSLNSIILYIIVKLSFRAARFLKQSFFKTEKRIKSKYTHYV
ncbi:TPA_asm: P6 [Ilex alphacytorhabdovirus 1]|nr:TPA_asm: P6 [Ilex alphacytorhabdovirus 1]